MSLYWHCSLQQTRGEWNRNLRSKSLLKNKDQIFNAPRLRHSGVFLNPFCKWFWRLLYTTDLVNWIENEPYDHPCQITTNWQVIHVIIYANVILILNAQPTYGLLSSFFHSTEFQTSFTSSELPANYQIPPLNNFNALGKAENMISGLLRLPCRKGRLWAHPCARRPSPACCPDPFMFQGASSWLWNRFYLSVWFYRDKNAF